MPNSNPCGSQFEVHACPCVMCRDRARLALVAAGLDGAEYLVTQLVAQPFNRLGAFLDVAHLEALVQLGAEADLDADEAVFLAHFGLNAGQRAVEDFPAGPENGNALVFVDAALDVRRTSPAGRACL